jgi:hypothetical protein
MNTLFSPGQVFATPGALGLAEQGVNLLAFLTRHLTGDWGDLGEDDKKENDFSVKNGFRILSAYNTKFGRVYIISEADRSVTTFLLPEEY